MESNVSSLINKNEKIKYDIEKKIVERKCNPIISWNSFIFLLLSILAISLVPYWANPRNEIKIKYLEIPS